MSLAGSRVVVTGASGGIGRAVALRCATEGARVALLARRTDELAEVTAAAGADAFAVPVDVRDPASIDAALATVVDRFGAIDGLVNNAGVILAGELDAQPVEDIVAVIETNLTGAILVTRAALGALRAAPRGRIVNIGSSAAGHAVPVLSAYTASKAGLEAFSRCLAAELVDSPVTVSLLSLGQVDSAPGRRWDPELTAHAYARWKRAAIFENVWGRRAMRSEVVADTVAWLLTTPENHGITHLDLRPD